MKSSSPSSMRVLIHGISAGLGAPRALSSHVRRMYNRKYKKVHAMPRIIFLFDSALVLTIFALAVLSASILTRPVMPMTFSASMSAPAISAAGTTPIAVHIRALGNDPHQNVRLQWHLPPGTEVISSDPPMRSDGTVFLGDMQAGQEVVSNLFVRTFRPKGERITFGFRILNIESGIAREYYALKERTVSSSALAVGVPEEFNVEAVVADGAVLPIRIENRSDRMIPYVELRQTENLGIEFPRIIIGDLPAHAVQYAFIPLDGLKDSVDVRWSLFAASRELVSGSWSAEVVSLPNADSSLGISEGSGDGSARVNVSGWRGEALFVLRPFDDPAIRTFEIHSDSSDIPLPPTGALGENGERWLAAVIAGDHRGGRVLGPASFGFSRASLPFSSSISYTTAGGDQIGVGPHPPVVGEETRYWVFWDIGPVETTVHDIRVRGELPEGVRATGLTASQDGGSWNIGSDHRTVEWTLEALSNQASDDQGNLLSPTAQFGFEIAVIPTEQNRGKTIELVKSVYAQALNVESGATFSSTIGTQYSDIFQKENPAIDGIVR